MWAFFLIVVVVFVFDAYEKHLKHQQRMLELEVKKAEALAKAPDREKLADELLEAYDEVHKEEKTSV